MVAICSSSSEDDDYRDYVDKRISTNIRKVRRSKKRQPIRRFCCSVCHYTSARQFNVTRHELRIHSATSKRLECCETIFLTKGEYYLHCEEYHPHSRISTFTSKIKYKIVAGSTIFPLAVGLKISKRYETSSRAPYMLRNRLPSKTNGSPYGGFINKKRPKWLESVDESDLENVPLIYLSNMSKLRSYLKENNGFLQKSSGYGTNGSSTINTSSDSSADNYLNQDANDWSSKMEEDAMNRYNGGNASSEYSSDLTDTVDHQIDTGMESTSSKESEVDDEEKIARKNENYEYSQLKNVFGQLKVSSFKQEGAVESGNCEQSSDIRKKIEYLMESEMKTDSSNKSDLGHERKSSCVIYPDYELKTEFHSSTLITSTPSNLPLKKRILQSLAIATDGNIVRPWNPTHDRLYCNKPLKRETKVGKIRKKCRLSRKKRLCMWKGIAASQCSPTSSDAENVPPGTPILRKQKAQTREEVDIRIDTSITWHEVTELQRDYLSSIDFDSFKIF